MDKRFIAKKRNKIMKEIDVLLVQTPYEGTYNFWKSENLGLGYLAAVLEREGFDVVILDSFLEGHAVEETINRIQQYRIKYAIGFSILSYQIYTSTRKIISKIKTHFPHVHIIMGGWFPTFWYKEIIKETKNVNSIIIGEGEVPLCKLLNSLKKGTIGSFFENIVVKKESNINILYARHGITDLNILPFPRRDYLPIALKKFNLATFHSSRGCSYSRCTFCSVRSFYKNCLKYRSRSVKNVVDEIISLHNNFGIKFIFFGDEDFIGDSNEGKQRAIEIFKKVYSRELKIKYAINCPISAIDYDTFNQLKKYGLVAVYTGIENCIPRMLNLFNKKGRYKTVKNGIHILKSLQLKLVPGFIMFDKDSNFEEIRQSIKFLKNLNPYHVNYLKSLYIMKETPMEKIYKNDIVNFHFYTKYFFTDPKVELLVRIVEQDYLPMVLPFTVPIYPIWNRLLSGVRISSEISLLYEQVNSEILNNSLNFVEQLMDLIEANNLSGVIRLFKNEIEKWKLIKEKTHIIKEFIKDNDSSSKDVLNKHI